MMNRRKMADNSILLRYNKIKKEMGEIRFAWNKIKNELSIIGDILLFATGIYFTIQSVNNIGFFYYMYIKPIVDFIDSNIIPLF